jgi:CRISPR system Cascade subunit CasE
MSTLYLVRISIALKPFHRWAAERGIGWSAQQDAQGREQNASFDEGQALHHLLSETFGKAVLQPFRLFPAPGQKNANLYAYSSAGKEELLDTLQACAMPETLDVCDTARLEVKPMPDNWREGRRLGFETRVRPMRRLDKPCGPFSEGAEVDAFLVRAMREFPEGRPENEDEQLRREAVYKEWLAERFGEAATIDVARLTRFVRHRASRKGRALEGPDATFEGDLTIGSPTAFIKKLAHGIGRHTAYGFGMVLIRPRGKS